ncbi:MAG: hypothetical protein V3T98_01305 [Candidatus Paceibacterota bacterium]
MATTKKENKGLVKNVAEKEIFLSCAYKCGELVSVKTRVQDNDEIQYYFNIKPDTSVLATCEKCQRQMKFRILNGCFLWIKSQKLET